MESITNGKLKIELGEVQKNLLLPLWGRAKEYEARRPLIKDKYAYEIIDKLDVDFDRMHQLPVHLQINSAVRAYNFDATLLQTIATYPDATIINIGAGLDTTFQRVDNGSIYWYDLDIEDTIQLRKQLIPEGERNRYIAKSVFDKSWFSDITVRGSKIFFIASGVLAYFKETEIKQLFLDIMSEFPGSEMIFEIYSRMILRLSGISAKKRKGSIRWAINSARSIAQWNSHITIVDEYPFYSRVNMEDHWDSKYLFPIRIIRFFNGVKMVHLQFSR